MPRSSLIEDGLYTQAGGVPLLFSGCAASACGCACATLPPSAWYRHGQGRVSMADDCAIGAQGLPGGHFEDDAPLYARLVMMRACDFRHINDAVIAGDGR